MSCYRGWRPCWRRQCTPLTAAQAPAKTGGQSKFQQAAVAGPAQPAMRTCIPIVDAMLTAFPVSGSMSCYRGCRPCWRRQCTPSTAVQALAKRGACLQSLASRSRSAEEPAQHLTRTCITSSTRCASHASFQLLTSSAASHYANIGKQVAACLAAIV